MLSVLADFYNLHLSFEWLDICCGFKVPSPADPNQQQRVIEFFKVYAPSIVRKLTEKERKRICELFAGIRQPLTGRGDETEENQMYLEISRRLRYLSEKLKEGAFPKEFLDVATFDGYKAIMGESWFCSYSYGYFAEEYRHIKALIDGYLDGYIDIASFMWLEARKKEHSEVFEAFIVKLDEGVMCFPEILAWEGKLRVSLDEYSPIWTSYYVEEWCPVKKRLRNLFHQIYTETTMLLQGQMEIKRCMAKATSKMPACQNIFIPQREDNEYCSKRCYNRIYQATKVYPKMKKGLAGIHKRGGRKKSF